MSKKVALNMPLYKAEGAPPHWFVPLPGYFYFLK